MRILVVSATDLEIDSFRKSEVGLAVEFLVTGIGMVNTSFSLTQRLLIGDVDIVINAGIAGSFSEKIEVGDVVEVVKDRFSELGAEDGEDFISSKDLGINDSDSIFINAPKTNLVKATGITVNTVHGNETTIEAVRERFNPDVETMESAAVMMVCKKMRVEYVIIRSISNCVERRNKENWNIPLAITNLNRELTKLVTELQA